MLRTTKLLALALCAALAACTQSSSGSSGASGPTGPPGPTGPGGGGGGGGSTPTVLAVGETAPSVSAAIVAVEGGTGTGGSFQPGDEVRLTFTLQKDDGTSWFLQEMSDAVALLSGPTFNYQRVLPEVHDVLERAVQFPGGVFEYTFEEPLPDVYAAPYNDSPAFGAGDGELAGTALLDGTYTVGLSFEWQFTVEGKQETYEQVGEVTAELLVGDSASLVSREVVGAANCMRCHGALEGHDGRYRDLILCLMCHTSGAEDANDPAIAGGTPGVSIESRVMFHRIHSGRHLPSVFGLGLNPDGTLDYDAPSSPLVFARPDGTVVDFSHVGFSTWPERTQPMPKDVGHGALPPAHQAKEEIMRSGVVSCFVCHGDPDGAGPLEAPTQGENHLTMMSRRTCGSCHDDIDWDLPYSVPQGTMPAQTDEAQCIGCHDIEWGGFLSPRDGHRHPLRDPFFDPGLVLELLDVLEGPGADGDGTFDPGERVRVEFTLQDDAGASVDPGQLDAVEVVLSGPSENPNLLLRGRVPTDLLTGPQPFALDLPEGRGLELVGSSTGALDVFSTARAPHLVGTVTRTGLRVRAGTAGGVATLAAAAGALQNFVDVTSSLEFAAGDMVVIDDGALAAAEYFEVRHVEGNRLWLSSPSSLEPAPYLQRDHIAGAPLFEVQLAELVEGVDWSLDAALGEITELVEFGAGVDVLVDYTTPFVLPTVHLPSLNDSPDLGEGAGEWTGKDLVSGTYRLGVWAHRSFGHFFLGEITDYRSASDPAVADVLVGSASLFVPYAPIQDGGVCQECHQDLQFHGGRDRGFDTCILCHGTAGAEDLPGYAAPGAPETAGTTVGFRTLLHRIHRGSQLFDADLLPVVGGGDAPGEFEVNTYGDYSFPQLPGRTADCVRCHGTENLAWIAPAPRAHPTQQGAQAQVWTPVCAGCHDAPAALAHMGSQIAPDGGEACALCHSPGDEYSVERVHEVR